MIAKLGGGGVAEHGIFRAELRQHSVADLIASIKGLAAGDPASREVDVVRLFGVKARGWG